MTPRRRLDAVVIDAYQDALPFTMVVTEDLRCHVHKVLQ